MSLADHFLDRFLAERGVLHVAADGQMLEPSAGRCPAVHALLPGSFNPIHSGHWQLAQVASEILSVPIAFELSVVNVDKPVLTHDEIRRRLMPFNSLAPVWLTHAARFVEKAEAFPGVTFVVGADTALRIVLARYYDDEARMLTALHRLRELECRFLVACRVDSMRQCITVGDLPIPRGFGDLFQELPATRFRVDLSSTDVRNAKP